MATHSSILAWETPWTEEPGQLQFMGSQRVGHNLVTKTTTGEGEPRERGIKKPNDIIHVKDKCGGKKNEWISELKVI